MNEKTNFIITAGGIFVFFFYYGILQEKLTRGRYGNVWNDGIVGERFTFPLSLVAVQLFVNWIFAKFILKYSKKEKDETHPIYYACAASTYLLSSLFATIALKWISYPTQVIAKSAKPISVMLFSVLLGGRTYSKEKYLFVTMIVGGVILFLYKNDELSRNHENEKLGKILVLLSLMLDGLTAAIQERMRNKCTMSGLHMMLNLNRWSCFMVSIVLVFSGEPLKFILFVIRNPQIIWQLLTLSVGASIGQIFIFNMITCFGSLANSLVTTTRKFFTILFSVLIFGNSLTLYQWLGNLLVFCGLFADIAITNWPSSFTYKIKFEKLY